MNDVDNRMFVLDIGTRFVRGLICQPAGEEGERTENGIRILECEIREHNGRAMLAGQIQDIEKVTQIVREIKLALEAEISRKAGGMPCKLGKVAVAVAGRNLMTRQGSATISRSSLEPITQDEIKQAELQAVQNALENITSELEYYCVGYSSTGHVLDGQEITNLIGHRGFSVRADVLVTLLPRQVLEAMFEVAKNAELEIDYLTLEPIAALEASITQQMKPLSLVLVDIGAGTSDIAVVSNGKIHSYGMVPVAGDAVTESIVNSCLVDFGTAERLKREASANIFDQGRQLEFRDIFDRARSMPSWEFLNKLRPSITSITRRLSDEIRAISGRALSEFAIILVGGGSLTPFIEAELSLATGVPANRVGVRPVSLNTLIDDTTGKMKGTDAATAAGIALMHAISTGLSLTHITLNDKRATMVSSEKNPNVLSVLLSNGITIRQIYGRPGLAKTYTLSGELRTVKGYAPRPATIEINGNKAAVDSPVREGDKLVFYPAIDGNDAETKIIDVLPLPNIIFNGKTIKMPARVIVNGKEAGVNSALEDRSDISYTLISNLTDVLSQLTTLPSPSAQQEIKINVDGEDRILGSHKYELSVNRQTVDLNIPVILQENDEIVFSTFDQQWKVADVAPEPRNGKDLKVKLNGEEFVFPGGKGKVTRNGEESGYDASLIDGDVIRTFDGKDAEAVLVDVFKYMAIDPTNALGKRIRLFIDGQESQYTSLLHDNAEVKVFFE
jgi:cell division protein FtsA